MFRYAAAVAVVLCLTPSWLSAQSTTLTVSAPTADVHKGPSTGSPVLGKARRGTVLEVTRELGSWVKVAWPEAQDGAAYVHVSMGSVVRLTPQASAVFQSSTRRTAEPPAQTHVRGEVSRIDQRLAPAAPIEAPGTVGVTPATHVVGLGATMAGPVNNSGGFGGFGASARGWRRDRVGVQLELSRYAMTSGVVPGRLTSLQIEPSVLYALPDRVTDYVWLRPYVGTGLHLRRQTFSSGPGSVSESDTGLGAQAFGGAELTFSGMPQFALSAGAGYQWSRTPAVGFETGGLGLTLAGHWYVR